VFSVLFKYLTIQDLKDYVNGKNAISILVNFCFRFVAFTGCMWKSLNVAECPGDVIFLYLVVVEFSFDKLVGGCFLGFVLALRCGLGFVWLLLLM
jgi:hypothetical protein